MARFVVGVPLILLLAFVSFAQNPPKSDPQAVSFASQSIAALTGGHTTSDVTLTDGVTRSGATAPKKSTATLVIALILPDQVVFLQTGSRREQCWISCPDRPRSEL